MTTLHAPTYDRDWGAISPSHEAFVRRLLELTRPRGTVLDAACGTGKYWSIVLGSGRTVVGVDQSIGMLRVAAANHPDVPVGRIGLQELAFDALFDAVMCVDAIENVGPEHWPAVLARLRDAARPGAFLYLTVELLEEDEVRRAYEAARAAGEPVVPGELFDAGTTTTRSRRRSVAGSTRPAWNGSTRATPTTIATSCSGVPRELPQTPPRREGSGTGRASRDQEGVARACLRRRASSAT